VAGQETRHPRYDGFSVSPGGRAAGHQLYAVGAMDVQIDQSWPKSCAL
jgi:hypothetical protein